MGENKMTLANRVLKPSRFTKHLIFLGLKIIGFIVGYGLFFLSYTIMIGVLMERNYFGVYSEYAKWSVPAVPTIGIFILVGYVLWSAWHDPKCQHCGKRLLDDPITLSQEGKDNA